MHKCNDYVECDTFARDIEIHQPGGQETWSAREASAVDW